MASFIRKLLNLTVFAGIFIVCTPSMGQDRRTPSIPLDYFYAKPDNISPFRMLLSKIHFGFSVGYGRTFYNQDLSGYAILQQQGSTPLLFSNDISISGGNVPAGYRYWFNDIDQSQDTPINPTDDFLISSDTTELVFRAPGMSLPLMATIHIEFFNRFKLGGGFMFEYHRPGEFQAKNQTSSISAVKPNFGSTFYKKYFVMLGAEVYRYYHYSLSLDAHVGAFNLSQKFNKGLIQKGVFVNIGTTVERDLSEYFTVFVRPSYDLKNFTINLPESGDAITTNMNAFYIGFGATFRVPELRRCFIATCATQVNHQHGNKEYRSRKHPFYKKQNPHHGENYPRLFKYKKKNKKKLNPY